MLKNSQDFVRNPEKYYNVLETKIDRYSIKPEKSLIKKAYYFLLTDTTINIEIQVSLLLPILMQLQIF